MINLTHDHWHNFQKVGTIGDIRQYFKRKALHLQARFPASVSMTAIHAVDKHLKAQNTEATNNRGARAYSGQCDHYSELLTQMVGLNF